MASTGVVTVTSSKITLTDGTNNTWDTLFANSAIGDDELVKISSKSFILKKELEINNGTFTQGGHHIDLSNDSTGVFPRIILRGTATFNQGTVNDPKTRSVFSIAGKNVPTSNFIWDFTRGTGVTLNIYYLDLVIIEDTRSGANRLDFRIITPASGSAALSDIRYINLTDVTFGIFYDIHTVSQNFPQSLEVHGETFYAAYRTGGSGRQIYYVDALVDSVIPSPLVGHIHAGVPENRGGLALNNLRTRTEGTGVIFDVAQGAQVKLINPQLPLTRLQIIGNSADAATADKIIIQQNVHGIVRGKDTTGIGHAQVRYHGDELLDFTSVTNSAGLTSTEGSFQSYVLTATMANNRFPSPVVIKTHNPIHLLARAYGYLWEEFTVLEPNQHEVIFQLEPDPNITLSRSDAQALTTNFTYNASLSNFDLNREVTLSEVYDRMVLQDNIIDANNVGHRLRFDGRTLILGGYDLTFVTNARITGTHVEDAIDFGAQSFGVNDHRTFTSRIAPYIYSDTTSCLRIWADQVDADKTSYNVRFLSTDPITSAITVDVRHSLGPLVNAQHGTGFAYRNFTYGRGWEVLTVTMEIGSGWQAYRLPEGHTETVHDYRATSLPATVELPSSVTSENSLFLASAASVIGTGYRFEASNGLLVISETAITVTVENIVLFLHNYFYRNLHVIADHNHTMEYEGGVLSLPTMTIKLEDRVVIEDPGKLIICDDVTNADNERLSNTDTFQNVSISIPSGRLFQVVLHGGHSDIIIRSVAYVAAGGFTRFPNEASSSGNYQILHTRTGLGGVYVHSLGFAPTYQCINFSFANREEFVIDPILTPPDSSLVLVANADIDDGRIALSLTNTETTGTSRALAQLTVTFNYTTNETFSLLRFASLMEALYRREEFYTLCLERQSTEIVNISNVDILLTSPYPAPISGVTYTDPGPIRFLIADGVNNTVEFSFDVKSSYSTWRAVNDVDNQVMFDDTTTTPINSVALSGSVSDFQFSYAPLSNLASITHGTRARPNITVSPNTQYRIVATAQNHHQILINFDTSHTDRIFFSFAPRPMDYTSTQRFEFGRTYGLSSAVSFNNPSGGNEILDVDIQSTASIGFEWDLNQFKAFLDVFIGRREVRSAMLQHNAIDFIETTATGVEIDSSNRVQFHLADGQAQDLVFAFPVDFPTGYSWSSNNSNGHNIVTNVERRTVTVDNVDEFALTYTRGARSNFTHLTTTNGVITFLVEVGFDDWAYVITADGYVPLVSELHAEDLKGIELNPLTIFASSAEQTQIDADMAGNRILFRRVGSNVVLIVDKTITVGEMRGFLRRIYHTQDFRRELLTVSGLPLWMRSDDTLMVSDHVRILHTSGNSGRMLFHVSSGVGGADLDTIFTVTDTTRVDRGFGRLRVTIPVGMTNPNCSYKVAGTTQAFAAQDITGNTITIEHAIGRNLIVMVTSDNFEPYFVSIQILAQTTYTIVAIPEATLPLGGLPTGSPTVGFTYETNALNPAISSNRFRVTFSALTRDVVYSLGEFRDLMFSAFNTAAYRVFALENDIERLISFGGDSAVITEGELYLTVEDNDDNYGISLGFQIDNVDSTSDLFDAPAYPGFSAVSLSTFELSISVPAAEDLIVAFRPDIMSDTVIERLPSGGNEYTRTVTLGDTHDFYVFANNMHPERIQLRDAGETNITLTPTILVTQYTSAQRRRVDQLIIDGNITIVLDSNMTFLNVVFTPTEDILLVLGEVHALMESILESNEYINLTVATADVNIIQRQNTNFVFNNMDRVFFIIQAGSPAGNGVTLEFNHTAGYEINPERSNRRVAIRTVEGGISPTQLNAVAQSIKDCIEQQSDAVIADVVKTIR